MLRETDVPTAMTQVGATLARALRRPEGAGGPMFVTEGDDEIGISRLRPKAEIATEFRSGSARPLVGPGIRMVKRIMRRGLRWYLAPMMEQQSLFNHSILDLLEKVRLQNERLRTQLELSMQALGEGSRLEKAFSGCERVLVLSPPLTTASPSASGRRPVGGRWTSEMGRLLPGTVDGLLLPGTPTDAPAAFAAAALAALCSGGVLAVGSPDPELQGVVEKAGFVDVRTDGGLLTARVPETVESRP